MTKLVFYNVLTRYADGGAEDLFNTFKRAYQILIKDSTEEASKKNFTLVVINQGTFLY